MKWYYASNGQQAGPVEEPDLDGLVQSGVVRGDTLVWHEGMPAWQPYGSVRGIGSVPPTPQPPPDAYAQAPSYSPAAAYAAPITGVRYAGFWIRFLARVIDGLLLGAVNLVIRLPLLGMLGLSAGIGRSGLMIPAIAGMLGISILISIAVGVAYEVYFVSSRGATPGKMALGLKIIRVDGSAIPPSLALGRYFAQWLSGAIFMIGYIMAGLDERKRALHDRICDTLVIHTR